MYAVQKKSSPKYLCFHITWLDTFDGCISTTGYLYMCMYIIYNAYTHTHINMCFYTWFKTKTSRNSTCRCFTMKTFRSTPWFVFLSKNNWDTTFPLYWPLKRNARHNIKWNCNLHAQEQYLLDNLNYLKWSSSNSGRRHFFRKESGQSKEWGRLDGSPFSIPLPSDPFASIKWC